MCGSIAKRSSLGTTSVQNRARQGLDRGATIGRVEHAPIRELNVTSDSPASGSEDVAEVIIEISPTGWVRARREDESRMQRRNGEVAGKLSAGCDSRFEVGGPLHDEIRGNGE
jgi:hypothetical protein